MGGAGGFSKGIRLAVEMGYEYVWVMDDDTMVQKDALRQLLAAKDLLVQSFGFLCSDVRWMTVHPVL